MLFVCLISGGEFLAAAQTSKQETYGPNSPVAYTSKGNITITINELLIDGIRYNLPPENIEGSAALFTAVKFFLDDIEQQDAHWHYRRLVVSATRGLSTSVIPLLKARTFKDFLKSVGVKITTMSFAERKERKVPWPNTGLVLAASNGPMLGHGSAPDLHYVLYPNLELWIDERVLRVLERVHFDFKKMYTEVVRDAMNASQSNK